MTGLPVRGGWDVLKTTGFAVVVLGFFFTAMAGEIALFHPGGESDDAEMMLLSQSFALGYEPKNPPLFTWIVTALMKLAGPTPVLLYAARMGCLFLMYVFLLLLARELQPDRGLAVAGALSPLLTLGFNWYPFYHLTHTVAAAALYPLCVWLFLRLHNRAPVVRYIVFGLAAGLGVLSKYTFAFFLVALGGAALVNGTLRKHLLDRRMVFAVLAGLLVAGPHLLWLVGIPGMIEAQAGQSLRAGGVGTGYLTGVAAGFVALGKAFLNLLLFPWMAVMGLAFWYGRREILEGGVADSARRDRVRFLRDLLAILGAGLVLLILAGATRLRWHHLFFFNLLPVWFFARLDAGQAVNRGLKVVFGAVAIQVMAVLLWFPVENIGNAAKQRKATGFMAHHEYAEAMKAAGFRGGTIVNLSRRQAYPAAMLRTEFPDTRFISLDYPTYDPPVRGRSGDCMLVWAGRDRGGLEEALKTGLPERIGDGIPEGYPVKTTTAPLVLSGLPGPEIDFMIIPGGWGTCR